MVMVKDTSKRFGQPTEGGKSALRVFYERQLGQLSEMYGPVLDLDDGVIGLMTDYELLSEINVRLKMAGAIPFTALELHRRLDD